VTDLPFTCTPSPCTCSAFKDLCEDSRFGAQVREQCPATCGRCNGVYEDHQEEHKQPDQRPGQKTPDHPPTPSPTPAPTPTPMPMPAPAPTPAPQPPFGNPSSQTTQDGGCCENAESQPIQVGEFTYTGTCLAFHREGFCEEEQVRLACPVSCGVCVPEGCEDDPEWSSETSAGRLMCKDWADYVCWDNVKPHCPTACRVGGCAR